MKVGLIVSFYDEDDVVRKTLEALRLYDINSPVVCIHSDSGKCSEENLNFIRDNSKFVMLPNLASQYHKYELPAVVVSRNYSRGFQEFYKLNKQVDYIIAILGDTYIYDFEKLIGLLNTLYDKRAAVLQAIGQNFHSKDADPINGRIGGRLQTQDTTDIMPQFFVIDGNIRGFTNIKNENKWTSEQNLGDELCKHVDFKDEVVRLNTGVGAYSFNCGLRLQVKGLGHTRC